MNVTFETFKGANATYDQMNVICCILSSFLKTEVKYRCSDGRCKSATFSGSTLFTNS